MSDFFRGSWLDLRFKTDRDCSRAVSNRGDRYRVERMAQVDDSGRLELKITGKMDLYDEIQSHKDSCDLNIIVDRILHGDEYARQRLKAREGMYGDFAEMPATKQEMLNQIMAAEDFFNRLPVEEKQKYNNNMYEWLMNFDQNLAVDVKNNTSVPASESTISSEAAPVGAAE